MQAVGGHTIRPGAGIDLPRGVMSCSGFVTGSRARRRSQSTVAAWARASSATTSRRTTTALPRVASSVVPAVALAAGVWETLGYPTLPSGATLGDLPAHIRQSGGRTTFVGTADVVGARTDMPPQTEVAADACACVGRRQREVATAVLRLIEATSAGRNLSTSVFVLLLSGAGHVGCPIESAFGEPRPSEVSSGEPCLREAEGTVKLPREGVVPAGPQIESPSEALPPSEAGAEAITGAPKTGASVGAGAQTAEVHTIGLVGAGAGAVIVPDQYLAGRLRDSRCLRCRESTSAATRTLPSEFFFCYVES